MVACKIELARKTGEVVCKTEVPSPTQLERFRCMLRHENLVKGPLDLDSDESSESDSSELADTEKTLKMNFMTDFQRHSLETVQMLMPKKTLKRVMARCLLWAGSPMNLWIMQKLLMRLSALKTSNKLSLDTKSVSKRKPKLW